MYEVREIINKSFSRAPAHLTVPQTPTLATGDIIKLRAEDLWDVRVKYRMG